MYLPCTCCSTIIHDGGYSMLLDPFLNRTPLGSKNDYLCICFIIIPAINTVQLDARASCPHHSSPGPSSNPRAQQGIVINQSRHSRHDSAYPPWLPALSFPAPKNDELHALWCALDIHTLAFGSSSCLRQYHGAWRICPRWPVFKFAP